MHVLPRLGSEGSALTPFSFFFILFILKTYISDTYVKHL